MAKARRDSELEAIVEGLHDVDKCVKFFSSGNAELRLVESAIQVVEANRTKDCRPSKQFFVRGKGK